MVTPDTRKSIENFLSELKDRIDLLSGNKVTANVDSSKIDEINQILAKYNISTDKELTLHDLANVKNNDIKLLLSYVGQNKDSIEYMMNKVEEYYESIANIINKYIYDFISFGSNQAQMINEKINLYQEYISLFEQPSFSEPFNKLTEISKVMSEIGMLDEDKWKILAYIAEENNRVIEDEDINLSLVVSREHEKIAAYLEDDGISTKLKSRLENSEVDIDTIPTIAAELSELTGVDTTIMVNIISVIIASNLLDRYALSGNKDDKEEINTIIKTVLSNIKPVHDIIYYEAIAIKNEKIDFYYNSLENPEIEESLKSYVDKPISELESETNSREYAIELKELAVIKPIFETIETIDTLELGSSDYQKAINILKKLIEQYKLLEEKKVTKEEKKN